MLRSHRAERRGFVDPAVLCAGTLATALVAGLLSIVGVVVTQAVPAVHLIAPEGGGRYSETTALRLTAAAVVAALGAAVLMHLLLLLTPRPFVFFWCIAALMTMTVTLWPFTTGAPASAKAATALVHSAIGLSVAGLTAMVARQVRW